MFHPIELSTQGRSGGDERVFSKPFNVLRFYCTTPDPLSYSLPSLSLYLPSVRKTRVFTLPRFGLESLVGVRYDSETPVERCFVCDDRGVPTDPLFPGPSVSQRSPCTHSRVFLFRSFSPGFSSGLVCSRCYLLQTSFHPPPPSTFLCPGITSSG